MFSHEPEFQRIALYYHGWYPLVLGRIDGSSFRCDRRHRVANRGSRSQSVSSALRPWQNILASQCSLEVKKKQVRETLKLTRILRLQGKAERMRGTEHAQGTGIFFSSFVAINAFFANLSGQIDKLKLYQSKDSIFDTFSAVFSMLKGYKEMTWLFWFMLIDL